MMLVISLVGVGFLIAGLYCVTDRRPAGASAASVAAGAAVLALTGRHVVKEIDQPMTPSAPAGARLYMILLSIATLAVGVAVARSVFSTPDWSPLGLLGLLGAALALEVSFVMGCASIVQVRRGATRRTDEQCHPAGGADRPEHPVRDRGASIRGA